MALAIAGPPALFLKWSCRRCGKTDGVAKTLSAFDVHDEVLMRLLFDALRLRLARFHLEADGCPAAVSDFTFRKWNPAGRPITPA